MVYNVKKWEEAGDRFTENCDVPSTRHNAPKSGNGVSSQ